MARRVRDLPSKVTLEQSLRLKQVAPDVFETVQRPWTWAGTPVVPGGLLMASAAAAAYETGTSDFALDLLQAHFLNGTNLDIPFTIRITRVNDGGRFITRNIILEQRSTNVASMTCTFVRASALGGTSMLHSVQRATAHKIDSITLDDLAIGRTDHGPWMKFQRFPLTPSNPESSSKELAAEQLIYTSAANISPSIKTEDVKIHALGVLALSDYHILDCPPHLHGRHMGQPAIGDESRSPTCNDFERATSLNHTIHFRAHSGFRADDLLYIEARSSWTGRRRGLVESRIFTRDGVLIASCVQGAYYVLRQDSTEESKL